MNKVLLKSAAAVALLALCSLLAFGQVSTTGSIAGTVTDPSKAVVAGASVTARNNATGVENTVTTAENGTFSVPALATGVYTVTISASNFKQTVVKDVKVNVGTPSNINVELEVGAVTETVTITGGGGELLQTQSSTVGTTITGRQIIDLPFTSRDALDLVLLLPGTATPGTPRTSTVNGLPKGALNITLDGVNVQDNSQKSAFGGGFFTYVRPRIDAIDEVTISTATPGAESSGEGAVQIKFVTRSGSSSFHGSLYEYHREPSFNANYWFNNKNGLPRDPVHLNQYGGRVGGPIMIPHFFNTKRDKAFFFTNLEEFRLPEAISRTRTILNPLAQSGVFTTSSGATVNLLTAAAATDCNSAVAGLQPCTATVDPTIGSLLAKIRSSTSQGSVTPSDKNRDLFNFTNIGGQLRRIAAVRFDYNITQKHHFENIWNYQRFGGADVDFLNSVDPPFPGFLAGVGGQHSLRFDDSMALRSTLTSKLINEARFGVQGGNSFFRDSVTPAGYADNGGFSLTFGAGLTNPQASRSGSRRNSPVKTFSDTLSLVEGAHSLNFGGTYSRYNTWSNSLNNIVPAITFGLYANDPANAIFTVATPMRPGTFPIGTPTADVTLAQSIYSLLTGRVTAVSANAYLDETTGKLVYLGPQVNRFQQNEYGLFVQDSWRYRPNLTLNMGLRWEVQEPFTSLNNAVTIAPFNQIFGRSGVGNLFRPGASSGQVTQLSVLQPGQKPYNTDFNNFLPSVGLAYSPDWKSGLLHRFIGSAGQTVLRAGYSIATVREGSNIGCSILASNPGGITSFSKTTSLSGAQQLTPGTLFRDTASLAPPALPTTINFPFTGITTD
ncbi:MAG: TonB-dependent receptor domain-containing protein, partial [Pyrinomonadaceae bacterium]